MKSKFTSSIAQKSASLFIVAIFSVMSVSAFTTITVENHPSEPVKSIVYQTFTARVTDKSVLLDWNTLSELNNGHFEVERSFDMNEFKTVGLVLDGFKLSGSNRLLNFYHIAIANVTINIPLL